MGVDPYAGKANEAPLVAGPANDSALGSDEYSSLELESEALLIVGGV